MKLTKSLWHSSAWILVPSYLAYVFAVEIFDGLSMAAELGGKIR